MNKTFWLSRWQQGRLGFHRPAVHPLLLQHWPMQAAGKRVLVPLCGKSLDLVWLWQQGAAVTGIDLAAAAADQFYAEQRAALQDHPRSLPAPRILCADFLSLPTPSPHYQAAYDRAALVALPPMQRKPYVSRLAAAMAPAAPLLLISLEYPPEQDSQEPPFAIAEAEIRRLFSPFFHVTCLARYQETRHRRPPRLVPAAYVYETAYLMQRIAGGL